jgi:F0F1-type ATP synthase assembly protein I
LDSGILKLLLYQMFLVAGIAAVFLVMFEPQAALSVGYGGGIAATNAVLLGRCSRREARRDAVTAQHSLVAGYACAVQRFLIVALLFAAAMMTLKEQGLAILSGFVAGQLVLVIFGTQQLRQK